MHLDVVNRAPLVLAVHGDVTIVQAEALRARLQQEIPADAAGLILDLSGVLHLDSAGIAVVIAAYRRVQGKGDVAVVAIGATSQVLARMNLHRLPGFHLVESRVAAVQALGLAEELDPDEVTPL